MRTYQDGENPSNINIDISALKFINDNLRNELLISMKRFEINTPLRAAHFISQCKHESGNFLRVEENLNYSANGLRATFSKHFQDIDTALHYEKRPEKIANRVYANRMGNGDELSGDGWKYRGRGYIQLTGKNNYTLFGKDINEDLTKAPELLVSIKYACLSAAWFFYKNGLNSIADQVSDNPEKSVQEITKKINGGLNGITERIENFKQILPLISVK